MIDTRTLPAALLAFAMAGATLVSFIVVTGSALRFGVGSLALPVFVGALTMEAAKVALPVIAFRLWRRGDAAPAKGVMALWCIPFAVCAFAAFTFAAGPQTVHDRSARDLLARKVAALKSMELARDDEDMDYEIARGYAKRISELNKEIAELRAKPLATARSVTTNAPAAQIAGVLAILNELVSASGLLALTLAMARRGEPMTPELRAPVINMLPETPPTTIASPQKDNVDDFLDHHQ